MADSKVASTQIEAEQKMAEKDVKTFMLKKFQKFQQSSDFGTEKLANIEARRK